MTEIGKEMLLREGKAKSLANIFSLNLMSKGIKKIQGLEDVVKLKELDLSCNEIEEIDNLMILKDLRILTLSSNKIQRIERLRFGYLTHLNLSYNEIGCIENMKNLKVFILKFNSLLS